MHFAEARALIYQRALGTLAHELGNVTSPLSLIADVLDAGRAHQMSTSAGTVRLVATALARTAAICRFLRGTPDHAVFSPATISDTAAWWLLCAPFAADMLPASTTVRASLEPVHLPPARYEALTWASLALARWMADSRVAFPTFAVNGSAGARGKTFDLHLTAEAPRAEEISAGTRQLRRLASWELDRAGGRLRISDREHAVTARLTLPFVSDTATALVS